jgi:lipopolysaccharide export system protein LptA
MLPSVRSPANASACAPTAFIRLPIAALLALAVFATPLARAEKADRDKPIHLEADRVNVDDAKRVQVLEGNVVLTQGTLVIHASKIVIKEDEYGFQLGSAFGGPRGLAHFKQKREGRTDYMEGEAEQIDYNTRTEIAEFFRRAWVKNGEDQVKGDYIWYDSIAEKYTVNINNGSPNRVRATLQPRNKDKADKPLPADNKAPARGSELQLQPAERLAAPPTRP